MKIKCIIFLLALSVMTISAKTTGIKTNLLYDATANANIEVETKVAPRWTVQLGGNFNFWKFSEGKQWRNYVVQPEGRYWFCDAFAGHFVGAHLLGGQYNIGNVDLDFNMLGTDFGNLKDSRYQGWFAGAGIAYGYAWVLAKHWNLEAEVGIGYVYSRYDRYPCAVCGTKLESDVSHHYFGPTKLALSIVYIF